MGAPMLLDEDVVGVLSVWRTEVDPFEDRAITRLTAFAAAAAIAVRNLDLVRALEARSVELGHKVDQLEALGQIGEAVSSSLDLDMVLSTIVEHAVQLSGTDGGSLMEFDETQQLLLRAYRLWNQRRGAGQAAASEHLPASHALSVAPRSKRGRCRSRTCMGRTWTFTNNCSTTPAGVRWWLYRCSARVTSLASSWFEDCAPATSRRRRASCCRPSRASQRWRSSTLDCSASSRSRPASWRSSVATSPSSSPACRTSCAHHSTL